MRHTICALLVLLLSACSSMTPEERVEQALERLYERPIATPVVRATPELRKRQLARLALLSKRIELEERRHRLLRERTRAGRLEVYQRSLPPVCTCGAPTCSVADLLTVLDHPAAPARQPDGLRICRALPR